jgi:hypothetical protein
VRTRSSPACLPVVLCSLFIHIAGCVPARCSRSRTPSATR